MNLSLCNVPRSDGKTSVCVECVQADRLLDTCVLGGDSSVNVIAPCCCANETKVGFLAPLLLNTNTLNTKPIDTPLN